MHFNSKSKFKGYAIVEVFTDIAKHLLTLNGFKYNSRKLVIEIAENLHKSDINKSIRPYNCRGIQRRKGDQGNLDTSSKNKNTAIRLAPATSSRQGESHTTPTGEEQGFWE